MNKILSVAVLLTAVLLSTTAEGRVFRGRVVVRQPVVVQRQRVIVGHQHFVPAVRVAPALVVPPYVAPQTIIIAP